MLKDEAQIPPTKCDALPRRDIGEGFAEELDGARARIQQAGDDGDERRLSTTARPDEKGQFASARLKIDAAQDTDAGIVFAE